MLVIFLLGLSSNLLTIFIPVSVGRYYDLVFSYNSHRAQILKFLPESWTDTVTHFLLLFLTVLILRFVFFLLYRSSLHALGELFIKQIKDDLFAYQLTVVYANYEAHGTGRYLLRYSGDINSLKNLFLKGTVTVLLDACILFISFLCLYLLNPMGAAIVCLGSATSFIVIYLLNKKIEALSIERRNQNSGQLSFVSRTLHSILAVLIFNKASTEHKKYRRRTEKIRSISTRYVFWDSLNRGFIYLVQYLVLFFVFLAFYLETQGSEASQSGSSLISFILLYITILPTIRRLFRLETVYRLGNISLKKLQDIYALPSEVGHGTMKLETRNPRLQLKDLSIDNSLPINFTSMKMEISKVLLPAGASKLSLIKAIAGIESTYKGKILINGQDIKQYDRKSLRKNLTVLSVHLPFIGRTALEAISYSRKAESAEKADYLLKKLATELSLPSMESNFNIGENAKLLNPIELATLAIARALLSRKKIILVDTPEVLNDLQSSQLIELLQNINATVIILQEN